MKKLLKRSTKARAPATIRKDGGSASFIGVGFKKTRTHELHDELLPTNSNSPGRMSWADRQRLSLVQIGVVRKERQRDDTLFLDYDARGTPTVGHLFRSLRLWNLSPRTICDVRTRRGWHRIIRLRERLTPSEIVAAQSLLGSDREREALNFMRILSLRRDGAGNFARSRWNILFERKL